jgi:hypothetical protein
VFSPSQSCYLHTGQQKHILNAHTDIHAVSGIRTHDPSVRASEDSSCLRPRGHCDQQPRYYAGGSYSNVTCLQLRPPSISLQCKVNIRTLHHLFVTDLKQARKFYTSVASWAGYLNASYLYSESVQLESRQGYYPSQVDLMVSWFTTVRPQISPWNMPGPSTHKTLRAHFPISIDAIDWDIIVIWTRNQQNGRRIAYPLVFHGLPHSSRN